MKSRLVSAEALDGLDPADPAARHARRDLARIHRAMATRTVVARGWQALRGTQRPGVPWRVLELGCGDGTLLLGVARLLPAHWTPVELSLLDRVDIVSPATLAAYAALGWTARVQVADVLDWARAPRAAAAPANPVPPWDLISTTLFLHHFEGPALRTLLGAVACGTQHFFACEPRRAWPALAGAHLVGLLGAHAVTRQDAVLSVHAGWRGRELTGLWPGAGTAWQCREYGAGLFSHCFSAARSGVH